MTAKPDYTSVETEYELTDTAYLNPKPQDPKNAIRRSLSKKEVAKLRWLPWLVFAFAVNTFFFISMLYALIDINRYGSNKLQYLFTAWAIFLIPSILVALLVMTPYPRSLRRYRHRWSDKEPSPNFLPGVNFIGAIACLVSVVLYLYIVAIPQYRNAKWVTEIQYSSTLPLPAVAIIFWSNATTPVTLTQAQRDSGNYPTCRLSNVTSGGAPYDCSHLVQLTTIQNHAAIVFDPTKLPINQSTFKDLQSTLALWSWSNYDSRIVGPNTTSTEQFTVGATLFDPRMDTNTVSTCGLIGSASLPSFSTTYADIELTKQQDDYDLLNDPSRPQTCADIHERLLSDTQNPYQSWSWALNAMSLFDRSVCDVAQHGNDAICATTMAISYGTQMTNMASSGPGISKLDIWINAGSIVGGVQFFFWFLTLFSAY